MCDSDLTKWEQDAISTVEQNYEESANFAQVDSEGCRLRLESRFKEVALAITQLYTSYSHALGSPQHRQDAYNAFRAAACKLTDFYNESKGFFNKNSRTLIRDIFERLSIEFLTKKVFLIHEV